MSDAPVLTRPDPSVGKCKLSSVLGLTPLIELYGQSESSTEPPVQDPLSLFLLEEKAARAGDLGVSVRQTAADGRSEVVRTATETLGPLRIDQAFFENNGYGTVLARWVGTVETARDTAGEVFDEVHVAGLGLSQQFKDKSASEDTLAEEAVKQSERVETALTAFRLSINATREEITKERRAIDEALRSYAVQFQKEYVAAEEEVSRCLRWGYPEAGTQDQKLRAAFQAATQARTGRGYGDAIMEVARIRSDVARLITSKEAEYNQKLKTVTDLIAEVQKKVDAHKRLGGMLGTSLNDEQVILTEGKIAAAKQFAESGRNLKALDAAFDVATEAKLLIDAIDDPSAAATLKAAKELLSKAEKKINEHKKIRPNDGAATQKALDKVRSDSLGLAPAPAKSTAETFSATVLTTAVPGPWTTYQGRAQTQIKWKLDYETKATALELEVKKFDKAFGGTAYTGTMVTDLKTLRALVATEAKETTGDEAQKVVVRIEETIAKYKPAIEPDPDNVEAAVKARDALTADQMEAMRVAEELAAAKKAFDEKYQTVKSLVDGATTSQPFADLIDADKASAAEYDQCKELVKSAKTTADKSKDYKTATHLLDSAVKDLTKLRQRSTGELFDDLKKMGRVWKAGALGFAGNVEKLKAAMTKALEDMEEGDAKQARMAQIAEISKSLDELTAFFQPNAFDDCAARFDGLKDALARKREREEVLRRVRLYRDAIKGNPMMKSIVANPFGVAGVASGLYAQLNKIELMTLRTL